MSFIGTTAPEQAEMLREIGVERLEDLFADIPGRIRISGLLNLPEPISEIELCREFEQLAGANSRLRSFLGAGVYPHHIPAAVDQLALRSEFYTAYTPYQPEVSQGTLTAIFEFQTMLCRLTGMEVANASMYDGATALAEAVLMALRAANRSRVVVSDAVHPHYRGVLKTYAWANGAEVVEVGRAGGTLDCSVLEGLIDRTVGAVVVQSPNFFGCIEDTARVAAMAHGCGAYQVSVVTEPLSLGLLRPPGACGADIVCGEGQGFGNPAGFGGPLLGLLAARKEFMRRMPGRLVGRTVDAGGREAFVLTLQTREQHIRREKATSNICTNQGLCALRAVIYLSLAGGKLCELARLNHRLAGLMRRRLSAIGCPPVFERPYFNELAVRIAGAPAVLEALRARGYDLGLHLGDLYPDMQDAVLICCTEMHAPSDIDEAVRALAQVIGAEAEDNA